MRTCRRSTAVTYRMSISLESPTWMPRSPTKILADPRSIERPVTDVRTAYDAYLQGVRTLGSGTG
jgi:hypothetical protein